MDSGTSGRNNNAGGKQPVRKTDTSKAKQSLPIFGVQKHLMEMIRKSQTLIVLGETGSGKTTQIPQFIYHADLNGGKTIAITQPRRVAAITVAKWVSMELGSQLGDTVGYTVRFEDVTSENTQIKYMTDGTLFREALSDRLLKNYNVIILDEAHERTVATDVLFGIVKKAQYVRAASKLPLLKVIIMSATMNCDDFSIYFNDCPVVYLTGRQYQVKIFQIDEKMEYIEACMLTVLHIHKSRENGDILVFLTGQEEIDATVSAMRRLVKSLAQRDLPKLMVYPLYAALPQKQQLDVFNPAPANARKVIFATNIAETSITISGIRYVVDSGRVKARSYNSITGVDSLKVSWISQAQAIQRAGRAGRLEEGCCYRAYSKEDYDRMEKTTSPEMLRCNLTSAVLQLLALGVNVKEFDFIDPPPEESIASGLLELKTLNAITSIDYPAMTPNGEKMSRLPLDPKYAKILLSAPRFSCLEEILTIVAMLSGENIFLNNTQKREMMLAARAKFFDKTGDHITLLNVYNEFKTKATKKAWCFENFLHERNLTHADMVRKQLGDICKQLGLPSSTSGKDPVPVLKCLLTGLFNNVAEKQPDNQYLAVSSGAKARIHPSSSLHGKCRPVCVLYTDLVFTRHNNLRNVSEIDPSWIDEVVPNRHHGFTSGKSKDSGGFRGYR